MNALHLVVRAKKFFLNVFVVILCAGTLVFLTASISCNKGSDNKEGNKNDSTQTNVVVSVTSMGAVGNGVADDTKAFQKTIDYVASKGGGTVVVPQGKYLIDGDTTVKIKSHITLKMDSAAQIIAKPTSSERFYLLMVVNAADVNIIGGKIIGDRDAHLGTTGEWGMGIAVYSGSNVTINGTQISNCWGDGIVIGSKGGAPYYASVASTNVTIKNVVSDNNRRQALTLGKVNGVLVDSCIFTNTAGTKPMDGIDIEPDMDSAQNITITNCELAYNKGNGVQMYENSKSVIQNIVVKNNFIHHNTYGGYIQRAENVEFTYNRIIQNKYSPAIKAVDVVNGVLTPNTYQ
jgi:polygalacturonase